MKKLIFPQLFVFAFLLSHAQTNPASNPKNLSFINNKVKYSIVILSCDTCVPISNIGTRVMVRLTKKEIKAAREIDSKKWMTLLKNDKTDWGANLILHSIYGRNAVPFSRHDNQREWKTYFKQDDIKYWEKKFSK